MKKKIFGIVYIVLTLGITVYICLYTADFTSLRNVLGNIRWNWLAGGLGCMLLYFLFEALPPYLVYKHHGYHLPFWQSVKVAMIGLYYSGITPSSTGGQPMQVYYYSKMKLPIGLSSYISVLKFIGFQSVMSIVCFGGFLIKRSYITAHFPTAVKFMYLGVEINVVLLAGTAVLLYRPAILHRFLNFVMKIIAKFVGRKAVHLRKKGREEIENFYASFRYSKKDLRDSMTVIGCSALQIFAYLSVSFFIHKAFAMPAESFWLLFIIQAQVVCAVSFIPLPGSAGAQEVGYYSFFLPFFGESAIFPAMILWRILSSYLAILTGAVCVTVDTTRGFFRKKEDKNTAEQV